MRSERTDGGIATKVSQWDHFSAIRVITTLFLLNPLALLLIHSIAHELSLTSITLLLLVLASLLSVGNPVWVSATIALEDFTFLNYFLINPIHTFRIESSDDLITLLVFLLATVSVSLLLKALANKQEQIQSLLAKFDQIVRRSEKGMTTSSYLLGEWEIDFALRKISNLSNESAIRFTPIEWRLLEVLVRAEGALVSHELILKRVWGEQYSSETNYLRLYLSQLRKKLEVNPKKPLLLITEQGVGYRAHSRRADFQ